MFPGKRGITRRLSTRLIIAFVAAIIVTTLAAGIPAYGFVHAELDRQAWARVADGERVTLALLEAEKIRLGNLASHAAQRPTLQELLSGGDAVALAAYLRTFQAGVDLDVLTLSDASGWLLAESTVALLSLKPPLPEETAFYTLPGPEPRLALLASQPIPGDLAGEVHVTAGIVLDDDFARRLAVETGFEQSLLIAGQRVATSLADAPSTGASEAVERATTLGQVETVTLVSQGARYYAALLPIRDVHGKIAALVEVALSVEEMVAATQRALLTLILSTILVAAVGSGLAGLYARRLTTPIDQLTQTALNISRGDFASPVPLPEEPYEVAALAAAFEKSRVNTRRVLDELSRAKAWSEALIQSIVEGIVTIDEGGRVTSFSQGAERITGWKSNDVLGMPVNQVFPLADGRGEFMEHLPPPGRVHQISLLTRDRREIGLAVTGAQLQPPDSDTAQMALVLRDVTEEEAVQRLRSYFLANISHEFRTPLSALNASVELLLEEVENLSPTEIAELLRSIHFSVTSLQTLIDNLLESSSIEAGRFRIHCHPTDMDEVVAEAVRVMQPLLERRRQNLALNVPAQLPLVNVDSTRLTQVLVNLLSNASKYSPMEQTIELSLKVARSDTGHRGELHVAVSDQGPGIPPAERPYLFRRFVRLRDKDQAQYGIGLGLAVVKAIVEEHGGKVGVDERPAGGSIFWFTIPSPEA